MNKRVVLRALTLSELSVYEQTLYPCVSDASGIAGEIHSPWAVGRAAQASLEDRKAEFAHVRCFVNGDYVVFLPLVAKNVSVAAAIAEMNFASVGERKRFFAFRILYEFSVFSQKGNNVIGAKLGKRSSDEQTAKPLVAQAHGNELSSECP